MKAYKLLSNRANWTVGANARDVFGESVPTQSKAAVQWCAVGAIEVCYPNREDNKQILKAVREACLARYNMTTSHVNDRLGREEILEVLKDLKV